jgi:hypothetical protein
MSFFCHVSMFQQIFLLHRTTKLYLLIGSIVLYCVLYCVIAPVSGHSAAVVLYVFPIIVASLVQVPFVSIAVIIFSLFISIVLFRIVFDGSVDGFFIVFFEQGGWARFLTAFIFSWLSYRFIGMYAALLDSQKKYRELNEVLEEHVKQRTLELKKTNEILQSEYALNHELFQLKETLRAKIVGDSSNHIAKNLSTLIHSINNTLMIIQGSLEIFTYRNQHLQNPDSIEQTYEHIHIIYSHLEEMKYYMSLVQLQLEPLDVRQFCFHLKELADSKGITVEFSCIDEDAKILAEEDILSKGLMYLFQYIQIQTTQNTPLELEIRKQDTNVILHINYGNDCTMNGHIPELIVDILQLQNLTILHQQEKGLIEILYVIEN